MHPVLFEIGSVTVYSYGFFIAMGAIGGVWYMAVQGKKDVGLTFDQANSLFLYIFLAAFIGGKLFLFFEDPSDYISNPGRLLAGRGFVFYGSFLLAIPTMLWFFRKHKLNAYKMLDVMAVTTCIVHIFGRIGCFMAGCCYGKPTDAVFGFTFTDPVCYAEPKGVPLHPTQLYEAFFIFTVMLLEFFRGDAGRGFIVDGFLSHSQFIALVIVAVVSVVYVFWSKRNAVVLQK
jgi:phosphatidylglycerol:prolipoprotein diacylglycerol transferase